MVSLQWAANGPGSAAEENTGPSTVVPCAQHVLEQPPCHITREQLQMEDLAIHSSACMECLVPLPGLAITLALPVRDVL